MDVGDGEVGHSVDLDSVFFFVTAGAESVTRTPARSPSCASCPRNPGALSDLFTRCFANLIPASIHRNHGASCRSNRDFSDHFYGAFWDLIWGHYLAPINPGRAHI